MEQASWGVVCAEFAVIILLGLAALVSVALAGVWAGAGEMTWEHIVGSLAPILAFAVVVMLWL